jgi:hypothetical protein
MKAETPARRMRRRFAFGALEQLSTIFGGITASVLTIGLFLPALNNFSGNAMLGTDDLLAVARLVLTFTSCTALAAMVLRGLARLLEDDANRGGMD